MEARTRPKILCVDDEPQVLEGIGLHLRRRCDVLTATSGQAGLEILTREGDVAVIVSDMRMPSMTGAVFLERARDVAPQATRLLLTGHSDFDSAIAAVNDGQIFRFLTKPCPPPALIAAVNAALEQHRLVVSEKVLLEETLRGAIQAMADLLALTSPLCFGHALRIKQRVGPVADRLHVPRWPVEVAALLSQVGCITLPEETMLKVQYGESLSEAEREMLDRAPDVSEKVLGSIPRLETVREILRKYPHVESTTDPAQRGDAVWASAHLLKAAIAFDGLEARGRPAEEAIAQLRGFKNNYDSGILDAFAEVWATGKTKVEIREIPLSGLRVGMALAEDLRMANGTLLVTRGFEVTAGFIERIRNSPPGSIPQRVRILIRAQL